MNLIPDAGQGIPAGARRFWLVLTTLAVGLMLLLWWVTLRDRPFDPESLRHFPVELLLRGRQFSAEVRTAATLQSLVSLALLLAFCFTEPGARILRSLERLGRGRFWLSLVAVAVGVTLLTAVVELPFDFYLGFLHERAYGLTQQTPRAWFTAHYQSLGIHLCISLLFWLPVYWLMRRWPRRWWMPAALFNLGFTALLALLSPVLLMPMTSHLVPVRDPQVLAMVQRLADQAGVKVTKVQEMQVSHRSSRVNAMVTGLGATKQIILYDTLLQQFPLPEVEVVMAHELAHATHHDVAWSLLLTGATEAFAFAAAAWLLTTMVGTGALRPRAAHSPRGLVLFLLLVTLFSQVTEPIETAVSRHMEVRADQFALTVTRNPEAFISGFRKLAGGNPGDVDPPLLVERLEYTHPSVMNRIRAAVRFEAQGK